MSRKSKARQARATLPRHGSLTVPYVARRASERLPDRLSANGGGFRPVEHPSGEKAWLLEIPGLYRDDLGWLWVPEKEDTTGVPEFGQVNANRHRRCMDELLCQVCGQRVGEPTTWLIPAERIHEDKPIITAHPPVCRACIPLARAQCPHLQASEWVAIAAPSSRIIPAGVVGDVMKLDGEIEEPNAIVGPNDPRAGRTLARQRVLALKEWRRT